MYCILIWQIFLLILLSNLLSYYSLRITKNISYHISEVLIFYADKLIGDGQFQKFSCISRFYSDHEYLMLAKYTCLTVPVIIPWPQELA